ncbi:MAG TPA: hypothetical protein VGJ29_07570, partial [Vicinamibacterales bacterium]
MTGRVLFAIVAMSAAAFAQSQPPPRDTPSQAAPAPPGRITGRVLAADNGHPIKRARVLVSAAELPGGRGVLTDDGGAFEITE